ncbi:hypothetical protein [Streptomyces sp. CB03911]|uniref:hypothetical protein n=1 Tax=Streptomycetaceae TaxID=2062 RepID=UPI00093C1254|nr:hypothetical protein [Streptomyces sp. CB03911]OKI13167.1 hypothetical protein A6A07_14685 [Streptomyces sp. CB03911]
MTSVPPAAPGPPPDLPAARDRHGVRVYPYRDPRPHPALGNSPISFVSAELWQALADLAIAPAAAEATVLALLRTIASDATDAALAPGNERAPRHDLYVSAPAYIGARRRMVWFQRDGAGGPVTAFFPPDDALPAGPGPRP